MISDRTSKKSTTRTTIAIYTRFVGVGLKSEINTTRSPNRISKKSMTRTAIAFAYCQF
ncbi:MAG: hypothetical protein M1G31_13350 [Pseudanabaena sp. Salubria-1]|nr:hypothetical protein [Pseudanabaena sp. Salubria-1]